MNGKRWAIFRDGVGRYLVLVDEARSALRFDRVFAVATPEGGAAIVKSWNSDRIEAAAARSGKR